METSARLRSLCARVAAGEAPRFVFFWNADAPREPLGPDCLSQWYVAPFEVAGVRYPTAEHFMMASKARLFGDDTALREILATPSPATAKALGRGVRGFQQHTWAARRFEVVLQGNLAKFGQSEALREYLVSTGDAVLVEASPHDALWGIGLSEADPRACDPRQWPGQNLLGFVLMTARERLTAHR